LRGVRRDLAISIIRLETKIAASPGGCFDLARDAEIHQQSVAASGERAVAGVTSGKLGLNDTVTWRATHFGISWELTSRITEFDPPRRFVDEMVRGPFHRLRHVHEFHPDATGTLMLDTFEYVAPFAILGWIADILFLRRYLRRLLEGRNAYIKQMAERYGDRAT
jgi:ligand-binding SRPBCC domain-containing protein